MRAIVLIWFVTTEFFFGCAGGSSGRASGEASSDDGGASAMDGSAGAAGAGGDRCTSPRATLPDLDCSGVSSRFASEVIDHSFGPGQNTGQDQFPELVLGAPRGAGQNQGATESVVSLGNGGWVTLGFGDNAIVDGPGVDFIVFENAFQYGADGEKIFAELATVSVSEDGESWVDFPCTAKEPPYGSCAGWHPGLANGDEQDLSVLDPATAGGDAYDLSDVCLAYARFVKITDRADLDSALDGVFDLDAVGIVNAACDVP